MTRFSSADVVRHPLVARIVDAYERAEQNGAHSPSISDARHAPSAPPSLPPSPA
jgi:hypothetical protein